MRLTETKRPPGFEAGHLFQARVAQHFSETNEHDKVQNEHKNN